MSRKSPLVGQAVDTYENYTVYETPFRLTEEYLKLNYFVLGLKLADTYKFTDACLNNLVGAADSQAYFANHMTDHASLM